MDRHRRQYEFFCSICSQEFIKETAKVIHEGGHADGFGLLVCEVCETAFTEEKLLYRHLDDVHDMHPLHGSYDLGKNNGERGEQTGIRNFFDEVGIQYVDEYSLFLPITGGGRRIIHVDFVIQFEGMIIAVEIDEHQHKYKLDLYGINKESMRGQHVKEGFEWSGDNRPVIFIRFNPHGYHIGSKLYNPPARPRYRALQRLVNAYSSAEAMGDGQEALRLVYMYYDVSQEGDLKVGDHEEFAEDMKDLIVDVVVDVEGDVSR
jgi:hypothetical protein